MNTICRPAIEPIEVTVLMPCLNEAETLAACILKANAFLTRNGVVGEVLIADNGSTDGSQDIARANGARVVDIPGRGYGAALQGGIRSGRGKYIIMGDSDDSYDFSALGPFLDKLREGYELVMGNRFRGGIKPGAMPPLHRYLGNPVLTTIGRIFFSSPCGDFHCGLRGFSRDAALRLDLQSTGMEFASEMVVKATIANISITEVPTTLSPDGRSRPPHLRSWRDGWRHLRFLLLFSPRWLFLYPGLAALVLGLLGTLWLLPEARTVGGITFDVHTLLYSAILMFVGCQSVTFWIFAKIYGEREGVVPPDPWFHQAIKIISVERGLIAGAFLLAVGVALGLAAVGFWTTRGFGTLAPSDTMRYVIPSATMILLGFHIIYAAFFVSLLDIRASVARAVPDTPSGAGRPVPVLRGARRSLPYRRQYRNLR